MDQEYAPTTKVYYKPTENGYEARIKARLAEWAEIKRRQRTTDREQKSEPTPKPK